MINIVLSFQHFIAKATFIFQPLFLNEVTVRKPPNPETESTLFIVQHTEKEYNLKAISAPER